MTLVPPDQMTSVGSTEFRDSEIAALARQLFRELGGARTKERREEIRLLTKEMLLLVQDATTTKLSARVDALERHARSADELLKLVSVTIDNISKVLAVYR